MIAVHVAGHACISEILKIVKVNLNSNCREGGYRKNHRHYKKTGNCP